MAKQRPGDRRPPVPARRPTSPPPKGKAETSPAIFILGAFLVLIAFGCGYGALTIQADVAQPLAKPGAPMQAFVVNTGDTFKTVTVNLEKQHLIRNATVFQYYIKFKGLNPDIQQGTYQVSPSMTFTDILAALAKKVSGPPLAYIAINEGMRITEYTGAIAKAYDIKKQPIALKNFSADEFLGYARDGKKFDGEDKYWFVQPWDITKGAYAALEGYLYPGVYEITQDATTVDILKRMLNAFGEKLCPGTADNPDAYIFDAAQCQQHQAMIDYKASPFLDSTGNPQTFVGAGAAMGIFDALKARSLTLPQALILASIVEREARTSKNQAPVASVYYNRFKNPTSETVGLLNADPVYQYYLGSQPNATDPWAPLATLPPPTETKNPYNLYAVKGLPPSAIANVSLAPLYAGIYPPATKYYYFFYAKSDCDNHYYQYHALFINDQARLGVAGAGDCKPK